MQILNESEAQSNAKVLKSLLLRAWRERWTEIQWSISVKKHLKDSNSSELAEILLDQMLVGSSPNSLMGLYLRHALSTQLISYTSFFENLVKFDDLSKPFCIKGLLEILDCYINTMCTRCTYEEGLAIGQCTVLLIRWLLHIITGYYNQVSTRTEDKEHVVITQTAANILTRIADNPYACALVHVAQLEKPANQMYRDIEKFWKMVSDRQLAHDVPKDLKATIQEALTIKDKVMYAEPTWSAIMDSSSQPLNLSINVFITHEIMLNHAGDIENLVLQLQVIQTTQKLDDSVVMCEMIRTCFMGLIDALKNKIPDEVKWSAFTFLKLPTVFHQLLHLNGCKNHQVEVRRAFERLLSYAHLLDLADLKCHSDCVKMLLDGCKSNGLLNSSQYEALLNRRTEERQKLKVSEATPKPSACLILRAEHTVGSILKTLDADYAKNQESMLVVLWTVLSGKSYELILAAASAKGQLQTFAMKLIKFNELAKSPPPAGESATAAQNRAMLFDTTFLMLCHILQLYGIEVITTMKQSASGLSYSQSYFSRWATRSLPEEGEYKCTTLLDPADPAKLDSALRMVLSADNIPFSSTHWQDMLHHVPYALLEVLRVWEIGVIDETRVNKIIDLVRSHMCCVSVVVATHLCSHINLVDHRQQVKAKEILKKLAVPGKPLNNETYYNERSLLMNTIVTKITAKMFPPDDTLLLGGGAGGGDGGATAGSSAITATPSAHLHKDTPALTKLTATMQDITNKCCVNISDVYLIDHLSTVVGPKWFCEKVVQSLLHTEQAEDLDKSISLIHSLFLQDLESLVLTLFHQTLPTLLQTPVCKMLSNPRGRALAKLCIVLLVSYKALPVDLSPRGEQLDLKKSRKRSRTDFEIEDLDFSIEDLMPLKLRKLSAQDGGMSALGSVDSPTEFPNKGINSKNPVHRALVNLFRLFAAVLAHNETSAKTGFVLTFLQVAIKTNKVTSSFILQFMPANMVQDLLRCLPCAFTTDELLCVCDLDTHEGREITAKVICQHARQSQNLALCKSSS